jgi:hypothetical protein
VVLLLAGLMLSSSPPAEAWMLGGGKRVYIRGAAPTPTGDLSDDSGNARATRTQLAAQPQPAMVTGAGWVRESDSLADVDVLPPPQPLAKPDPRWVHHAGRAVNGSLRVRDSKDDRCIRSTSSLGDPSQTSEGFRSGAT